MAGFVIILTISFLNFKEILRNILIEILGMGLVGNGGDLVVLITIGPYVIATIAIIVILYFIIWLFLIILSIKTWKRKTRKIKASDIGYLIGLEFVLGILSLFLSSKMVILYYMVIAITLVILVEIILLVIILLNSRTKNK